MPLKLSPAAFAEVLMIAIIVVLGFRLAANFGRSPALLVMQAPLVQPGSTFSVPGVQWPSGETTVVLFAVHDCPACKASVAFYQRLSERVKAKKDFVLFVLSPDPSPVVRDWLDTNRIKVEHVAQITAPPLSGLYFTPVVLIRRANGVVDTVFAGQLLAHEEEELVGRLTSSPPQQWASNVPDEIDDVQLFNLQAAGSVQLVDLRETPKYQRAHRRDAVSIPVNELPNRASVELSMARRVVLDCPRELALSCHGAGTFLRQRGFSHVSLLFSGLDRKR